MGINSTIGKKGALTRKQAKIDKDIVAQEAKILKLKQQILDADKFKVKSLRKEKLIADSELKKLKTSNSGIKAEIKSLTKTISDHFKNVKLVQKKALDAQIKEIAKAADAYKKAQQALLKQNVKRVKDQTKQEKRNFEKHQREWNKQVADTKKWKENRAGSYSLSGRFDKSGKFGGSASWTGKFKAGEDLMARQGIQNAIAKMKGRSDFKKIQSVSYKQNPDGTISAGVSADIGDKDGVMAKIKAVINKLASVVEFVIGVFKKLINGVKSVVKGLWNFGKKIVKIALGLPLFNALFAKLASLNGLTAFEFVGNLAGKGNGNSVRATSKLEQMFGTSGALMSIFENRQAIFGSPEYRPLLASLGLLGNKEKMDKMQGIKDAGDFGFAMFDELEGNVRELLKGKGVSLEQAIAAPDDAFGIQSLYKGKQFDKLMSWEDFAKYVPVRQKMQEVYKSKPFQENIVNKRSLNAQIKYQTTLMKWENFWIKLATDMAPYMTTISDCVLGVLEAFRKMATNNGGFKMLVDLFMEYFKKICDWLEKEGVEILDKAFKWVGEKIKEFIKWIQDPNNALKKYFKQAKGWLDTPDENGNTGIGKIFAIIQEVGQWLWDFGKTVATVIDIILFIPRKIFEAGSWVGEKIFGPSANAIKEFLGETEARKNVFLADLYGNPQNAPKGVQDAGSAIDKLKGMPQAQFSPGGNTIQTIQITMTGEDVRKLFQDGRLNLKLNSEK